MRLQRFSGVSWRWALVLGMGAIGCKTTASGVKHDLDQPVRSASAWNWVALNDAQIEAHEGSRAKFLPVDHPLSARTQFWLDRIDEYWRTKHPAELAQVPKPHGRIEVSSEINAFVPAIDVCYNVPVKFAGATGSKQYLAAKVFIGTGRVDQYSYHSSTTGCGNSTIDAGEGAELMDKISSFISDFNAQGYPCQLSLDDDGAVVAGKNCIRKGDLKTFNGAPQLVLSVTGNTPIFYTGLAKNLTEPQYVSVLGHELGHFYRSHITAFKNDYNYFYPLARAEVAAKPGRDDSLRDAGNAALVAVQRLNAKSYYAQIPGQLLRPDMYFMARYTADTMVNTVEDGKIKAPSCIKVHNLLKSPDYVKAIGDYPLTAQVTPTQVSAYQTFESQAMDCFRDTTLEGDPSDDANYRGSKHTTSSPYPSESWRGLVSSSGYYADPTEQVSDAVKRRKAFTSALANLAATTRGSVPFPAGAKTVADAMAPLRQGLEQIDASDQALMDSGNINFGFYTQEQEADDEGLETISNLGIPPTAMIDQNAVTLKLLGVIEPASGDLDYQDCEALRQQNWISANGAYQFVPIGSLNDIHHTTCYRMFNMSREIDAHHLVAAPTPPPLWPEAQWTALQASIAGSDAGSGGASGTTLNIVPKPDLKADPEYAAPNKLECSYAIGTEVNPLQM